jgi:hypothetical protein
MLAEMLRHLHAEHGRSRGRRHRAAIAATYQRGSAKSERGAAVPCAKAEAADAARRPERQTGSE